MRWESPAALRQRAGDEAAASGVDPGPASPGAAAHGRTLLLEARAEAEERTAAEAAESAVNAEAAQASAASDAAALVARAKARAQAAAARRGA